jgi:hypothetical protein
MKREEWLLLFCIMLICAIVFYSAVRWPDMFAGG